MPGQVAYYDLFGSRFEQSILECDRPELWTTDYSSKGKVYQEMKDRVKQQEALIDQYFDNKFPVLDIGCGFGRQAALLARKGFHITGTDTSSVFISIARKLFSKNKWEGNFVHIDILSENLIGEKFSQILLLDVLEHIPPGLRKKFFNKMDELSGPESVLIVSIPSVKNRISSKLNNRIRKRLTQHLTYFFLKEEHPYPIPEMHEINRLIKPNWSILSHSNSAGTEFYVLKKSRQ